MGHGAFRPIGYACLALILACDDGGVDPTCCPTSLDFVADTIAQRGWGDVHAPAIVARNDDGDEIDAAPELESGDTTVVVIRGRSILAAGAGAAVVTARYEDLEDVVVVTVPAPVVIPLPPAVAANALRSRAQAINNHGVVVGATLVQTQEGLGAMPTRWDAGVPSVLPGNILATAMDINDRGTIVGYTSEWTALHALMWAGGAVDTLLPSPSFAYAISETGLIAGDVGELEPQKRVFVGTPGHLETVSEPGTYFGGLTGTGHVGIWYVDGSPPARWHDGVTTPLNPEQSGQVLAGAENGLMAGILGEYPAYRLALWDAAGDLIIEGNTSQNAHPHAVNRHGAMAGTEFGPTNNRGFVFQDGVLGWLDDLISEVGDYSPVYVATDINDRYEVVVSFDEIDAFPGRGSTAVIRLWPDVP